MTATFASQIRSDPIYFHGTPTLVGHIACDRCVNPLHSGLFGGWLVFVVRNQNIFEMRKQSTKPIADNRTSLANIVRVPRQRRLRLKCTHAASGTAHLITFVSLHTNTHTIRASNAETIRVNLLLLHYIDRLMGCFCVSVWPSSASYRSRVSTGPKTKTDIQNDSKYKYQNILHDLWVNCVLNSRKWKRFDF